MNGSRHPGRGARRSNRAATNWAAFSIPLVAMACGRPAAAQEDYQHPSRVTIAWNRLYDFEQITQMLRDLATAYPELLKLESIGRSVQGRDIWAMTLNVSRTGRHDEKPGMYIDGNIHGNEAQAAETVVYSIWYLTKSYGKVEALTRLMDRSSFYFVPMANPDGRAYWFNAPNTASSSRGGQMPTDDDGDGVFDEDPPNDIDGDGRLLQMRRVDPNGRWRESADDPRILEQIPQGSDYKGTRYSRIFSEGIDDDGDGDINEDGKGGYDPNRDWPADWQPRYIQGGACELPLMLPESRAVANFILSRPNVAGVQAYHNSGGMLLRGPGAQYVEYAPADVQTYDAIGQRGEKMLPFYRYTVIWKDLYTVHGGFVNWTAEDLGIISFTNELWTDNKYYSKAEAPTPAQLMEYNDLLMFGQSFVAWKKFDHPQLGQVELGGWVKAWGRVPPPFHLEEECHRNFAFTVFHAEQMPRVEISNIEATPMGDGLTRVRADVCNRALIPTTTAQAALRRYGPRDYVELDAGGGKVVAGGTIANRQTAQLGFVENLPQRIWLDGGIGGDSCRTFEWWVTGGGPMTIRAAGPRFQAVSAGVPLTRQ